ncbi:MAG TPA: fluoride efflux transporter CrcB [Mycobacteriales bacterium]|jgi:crcB protein
MTALLVALGTAIGAPLRYAVDRFVQQRHDGVFPWGTFVVNVLGSLVLGIVTYAVTIGAWPDTVTVLVGAGLCGGFTTFSSFCFETWRLLEAGAVLEAELNLVASLLAGLAAAAGGWLLAGAIW